MAFPHRVRVVDKSRKSTISDEGWDAPTLSKALTHGALFPLGYSTQLQKDIEGTLSKKGRSKIALPEATFSDELQLLLEHIHARLQRGVEEAWFSRPGYGLIAEVEQLIKLLASAPVDDLAEKGKSIFESEADCLTFFKTPEEAWARRFCELVVYSAYGNPGITHFGTNEHNSDLFDAFPRVYPIMMTCQQLSTLCIISRGFTFKEMGSACGCTAGSVEKPVFEPLGTRSRKSPVTAGQLSPAEQNEKDPADPTKYRRDKSKFVLHKSMPNFANTQALTSTIAGGVGVTPGSIVVFNPGGSSVSERQDIGGVTHVASVLRVSGQRVQFLDTGPLVGNTLGTDSYGGEGGTTDHSFRIGDLISPGDCVGVGVLKAPPGLEQTTKALAKAHPFGFVRLALVDTSGPDEGTSVRFVSKLLHMRYPVSYYIWSLRGLPTKNLSAFWLIYTVQGTKMSRKVFDLLQKEGDTAFETAPNDLLKSEIGFLYLVNVIRGDVSTAGRESVTIARKKADGATQGWYVGNAFVAEDNSKASQDQLSTLGLQYRLSGGISLRKWSESKDTWGKRYTHKPGAKSGTLDEDATHVAFFDP